MTALTQSAYARLLGVSRSYITKIKAEGRIVMTADDLVDVEASNAKIAATRDPNRDDVAARHAEARQPAEPAPAAKPPAPETDKVGNTYQAARAVKEKYAAMTAKLDYERAAGLMIERAAVEAAVEDVMTTVRQALEQQPHRVAPMLVGRNLDAIRSTLKQANHSVLTEMVKEFTNRIRQMAGEDEE